jgi:Ca2+:H+ antiporter
VAAPPPGPKAETRAETKAEPQADHGGDEGPDIASWNVTVGGYEIQPLHWLFLAVPVAALLHFTGAPAIWVFLLSAISIVPLAGLMGEATEQLAEKMGPGIGGLMNATFGNAAELIIALIALRKGPEYYDLAKASLTGSIIGNILLVLGAGIAAGGLYHRRQTFNPQAAGAGSSLLLLAAIGLVVPAVFYFVCGSPAPGTEAYHSLDLLSEEIAFVLIVLYVLSLVFSLKTHSHLFAGDEDPAVEAEKVAHPDAHWSNQTAIAVLAGATVGIAILSEWLIGSVEQAAEAVGMNHVFIGVIVVAVVGNAAEHSTAILVAMKNKMDLAVNIAIGSSLQIAMFVAPVLVFASMLMGHERPMDLHFTTLEVVAIAVSVWAVITVSADGETHWMEGAMLLGVYVILGLAFYNLPKFALHA